MKIKEFLKIIKDIERFLLKKQITIEEFHDIIRNIKFKTNFDYENEAILDIINGEIHLKHIDNGKYSCKNNMKLTITNYKNLQKVYYLLLGLIILE